MEQSSLSEPNLSTVGETESKKLVEVPVRYLTSPSRQSPVRIMIDGDIGTQLEKGTATAKDLLEHMSSVYPCFQRDVHQAKLKVTVDGISGYSKGDTIHDDTHPKIGTFEFVIEPLRNPSSMASSASAACTLEEMNVKITRLKDLMKEFMKASSDEAFKKINDDLREQISLNYDAELVSEIEKTPLKLQNSSKSTNSTEGGLDFAFLYSNPLVKKTGNTVQALGEPVNFSSECKDIMKVLEEKQKQFKVHIECANQDQFFKVLRRKPKVLHIMCHGTEIKGTKAKGSDMQGDEKDYYLEFEGDNGELICMTGDLIRKQMANKDLSSIQLVFLNACHSEVNQKINQEIGKTFFEFGIKCLIAVKSDFKIKDIIATLFSKLVYQELIYGCSVQEAFDNAKVKLRIKFKEECESCCCGHSHRQDCEWYSVVETKGKAEVYHVY